LALLALRFSLDKLKEELQSHKDNVKAEGVDERPFTTIGISKPTAAPKKQQHTNKVQQPPPPAKPSNSNKKPTAALAKTNLFALLGDTDEDEDDDDSDESTPAPSAAATKANEAKATPIPSPVATPIPTLTPITGLKTLDVSEYCLGSTSKPRTVQFCVWPTLNNSIINNNALALDTFFIVVGGEKHDQIRQFASRLGPRLALITLALGYLYQLDPLEPDNMYDAAILSSCILQDKLNVAARAVPLDESFPSRHDLDSRLFSLI